jgi:hypothetical protein
MKGPVEKTAVLPIHRNKMIQILGICQVAARLPAHEYLLAKFSGSFEEGDMCTHFRGPACGHHAACSAANDYYRSFLMYKFLCFQ